MLRGLLAFSTGVLVAAATVAVPTSGAAGAVPGEQKPARVVLADDRGDVWEVDVRTSHWSEAGRLPAADVRRSVIRHGSRAVVVRMRFVDLRRSGAQTYWAGFVTPRATYFVDLVSKPGARVGRHTLYDGPAGTPLDCEGLTHSIDYSADAVSLRVPRGCLDKPRWVKVDLGNMLVVGPRGDRHHYGDNPHNDQPYSNFGSRRVYHR